MLSTSFGLDWARYLGSFALVIGLLAGLLWILRRLNSMQRAQHVGDELRLVETISVGHRQKISLVRVGSVQVLIGITPGQFTALGQWEDSELTLETKVAP